MKKLNRKGFTLVELLAVIIILAIVVGIAIPAVMSTTENARKKAFQTAADSAADWFDREYQQYLVHDTTVAPVDSNFTNICTKSDTQTCVGTAQAFTNNTVTASGLKLSNVTAASSTVIIDANTGRACVKLTASSNGDYPAGKIACGGVCTDAQCTKTY